MGVAFVESSWRRAYPCESAVGLFAFTPQKRQGTTGQKHRSGHRHPDRVIDAATGGTNMQLAEYYALVSPWMLPHLANRPVALVRAPEGINDELFFQKNAERLSIPSITAIPKAEAGKAAMVINSAEALIGAVQISTVEIHSWNATVADLDKPDRFVLDPIQIQLCRGKAWWRQPG